MEEYPLYINGKTAGTLSVYTEGLLTVFRAQCRSGHGIIKLYVFGEGKSAYLGTMQPGKNGQYLVRKLSRSEKSRLPSKISYAADAKLSDKEDDTDLWLQSPDGVLYRFDGEYSFVAIPAKMRHKPPRRDIVRSINGREYIIFPGKRNGGNYQKTVVSSNEEKR